MAFPTACSALAVFARPTVSNAVASSSRYLSTSVPRPASAPVTTTADIPEDAESALPVPFSKINKYLSFPPVKLHKPIHGVHVATLHLQSYQTYNLDLTTQFAVHSAHSLNIPTTLPAFLPSEKSLYTVLKSPFVKKKAQENFERKTFKRAIKVYDSSKDSIDLWLRYLRQNGLPGVGMKAYIHEYVEQGFGKKEQEQLQTQQDQTPNISEKKIQDAAQDLVKALSEEGSESSGQIKAVSDKQDANSKETVEKAVQEKLEKA
ncbi:ribosomal protein S10 [Kwoniella dendrophila CBS 6074]|uniref:Small ribosomal subunit protein uS10m n=1 Tax=Kwoniella dendrophila CBS 6074 TaxID=1295534 RepID=A0AAX4K518_9TREE